jgi:hypothetical protein
MPPTPTAGIRKFPRPTFVVIHATKKVTNQYPRNPPIGQSSPALTATLPPGPMPSSPINNEPMPIWMRDGVLKGMTLVRDLWAEINLGQGLCFDESCDLVIHVRIVIELLAECCILRRDIAEKDGGIAKQPAGDLSVCGHAEFLCCS